MSRGKITLEKELVTLSTVVETAIETSRPAFDAGEHQLSVTLPDEPVWLMADATRVAQVLGNLLNNAAKYTAKAGCVELHAARRGQRVVIQVRDHGLPSSP